MRDSDLDEMSVDEFNRLYKDTHTEIKAQSIMRNGFSGGRGNNIKEPSDRNISSDPAKPIPGKGEIEAIEGKKREDRERNYFRDAFWVRKQEVLDPEAMPISKLSDLVVKMMPQKVEGEVKHTVSYGDRIVNAAKELRELKKQRDMLEQSEEAELVEQDD